VGARVGRELGRRDDAVLCGRRDDAVLCGRRLKKSMIRRAGRWTYVRYEETVPQVVVLVGVVVKQMLGSFLGLRKTP
jgi:hypothetical protein